MDGLTFLTPDSLSYNGYSLLTYTVNLGKIFTLLLFFEFCFLYLEEYSTKNYLPLD